MSLAPAPIASPRLLVRHQIAAAIGTSADFGAMIAFVELAGLSPPVATILSAMIGGIVNFSVSRGWAFRARHAGTVTSQGLRYAFISAGGALLNASLLALVLPLGAIPYPIARAGIALAVSLLYTYPMHTRVVFRVTDDGAATREGAVTDARIVTNEIALANEGAEGAP